VVLQPPEQESSRVDKITNQDNTQDLKAETFYEKLLKLRRQ
jgi:hypothetical protein